MREGTDAGVTFPPVGALLNVLSPTHPKQLIPRIPIAALLVVSFHPNRPAIYRTIATSYPFLWLRVALSAVSPIFPRAVLFPMSSSASRIVAVRSAGCKEKDRSRRKK